MSRAVAYFRTSSKTNVGGDSSKRQREAVERYAQANDIEIVREFYDAAVSGADPIDARKGFVEMLAYMKSNGAKCILVENASRFARDAVVALVGYDWLKAQGFELIPVDAPTHFTDDTPTAKLVRTILVAVSEFEKTQTVAKLRAARIRKSIEKYGADENGRPLKRIEGGRLTRPVEHIERARELRANDMTLQAVADQMSKERMRHKTGRKYAPMEVSRMIKGKSG